MTARRVLAVAALLTADVVRGQRALFPVLVQCGVLAILFGGDPGPPPTPWAVSTLACYATSTWLALTVAHTESAEQRLVTATSAGGYGRLAFATALVALGGGMLLGGLSVLWPIVVGGHPYSPGTIGLGLVAHGAGAATGTAVGLLSARPFVQRIGWSFVLAVTVVTVTAVQPWLPPVGSAVESLARPGRLPVAELALALGLVGLVSSASAVLAPRRA